MFRIERVELCNFRAYAGAHVFDFPTSFGLYNLTGRNDKYPGIGPNGTGKSTLLDAIFWCLYGRTTRGLKASDVVSWNEKSCGVTMHMLVADQRSIIQRTQSPNTLTLDGTTVDQSALNKYLRLSPDAFLYSVIFPQFGESFFDLAASSKLTLFSQILELEYWLEKSHAADAKAKTLAAQINVLENVISQDEGKRQTLKNDLEKFTADEASFDQDQLKIVEGLERELCQIADDKFNYEELIAARKGLRIAEEKLSKLAGKNLCKECKQPIPNPDLKAVQQNKIDFEQKIRRVSQKQGIAASRKQDLSKEIAKEVNRENPYSKILTGKRQELTKLKEKRKEHEADLKKLQEEHVAVSFWVLGFKRVRLSIVEEVLSQFEVEVNNNLVSLGLTDWKVTFDVERENKSGGMTKGFAVFVHAPGHDEPVRYESWSGGETQRLRLAGDLGLANLIMERAGLSNNIEFFDEPSQHLSQEGLMDLAETLCQRAQDQSKVIFLVDHRVVDFSGFAGSFLTIKGPDGSRFG